MRIVLQFSIYSVRNLTLLLSRLSISLKCLNLLPIFLTALGYSASLVAAVGYRHEDDATQHLAKVRKSTEELFETI